MKISRLPDRLDRMPMLKILVFFAAGIVLAGRYELPLWFLAGAFVVTGVLALSLRSSAATVAMILTAGFAAAQFRAPRATVPRGVHTVYEVTVEGFPADRGRYAVADASVAAWRDPADGRWHASDARIPVSYTHLFSQPVERRPVAPEIHEVRTWRYRDGDGAVARFDAGEEAPLGAWSFAADSYAAMQGEKVLRNPLFSPSLNAAGHYLNAPSALIPEVGDRDDAEEDGTNFTLRIVRYAGMHPLPGDERWGYPSGRSEYPLAAFHFAGDDAAEGFTLCFEDRDGQQGLHRFYDGQVRREASRERIILCLLYTSRCV